MTRKLYLFDFDGTLTKKDSLFDFLKFSFPSKYFRHFILFIPLFILARLKILDPGDVKEKLISSFLKGKSAYEIAQLAQNYFDANHQNIIFTEADKYIKNLSDYNDKYLVSASLDIWLKPFSDYYGMGLICTKAQFDENGYFTGKFATSNCNYQEKKKRIEDEIDLSFYDEVIAFGDTEGDEIMFSLATKSYLKFFN